MQSIDREKWAELEDDKSNCMYLDDGIDSFTF